MNFNGFITSLILGSSIFTATSISAKAVDSMSYDRCLISEIKIQKENLTLKDVKNTCKDEIENISNDSVFTNRIKNEMYAVNNPFSIQPHKMNYILPFTYSSNPNREVYAHVGNGLEDNMSAIEAKYQISFKVPLTKTSLFFEGDRLYAGFTLKSWWQIYSENISKPFRENNYQPELFYVTPVDLSFIDSNTWFMLGLEHESNGKTQALSRSWNRVYANFIYEERDFAFSFRPWWRLPEDEKNDPLDDRGDDNPLIEDYMGHFEIKSVYKLNDYNFSILGRQNLSTNKGYLELGLTFPLWGNLRGYIQYLNGYGESLIDFDSQQQKIGIGIALTDII